MVSAKNLTKICILTGTTASGKTACALEFARRHPLIEVINADSLQVYQGMDIGTAKPTREERLEIPHHLIDIRMPHESYNAGDFEREARLKILEIFDRGKKPLIVGGTGFYLKALIYGLWEGAADPRIRGELEMISSATLFEELKDKDPLSAQRIGLNDRYRLLRSIELLRITGKTPTQLQSQKSLIPDPQFELLVLDQVDSELTQRISTRTDQMIARGLVEETQGLLQKYPDARALRSVGYLQCIRFLQGDLPPGRKVAAGISGLKDEINLATRQLVKAQRTWFKGQKSATHFNAHADALRVIERLEQVYAT